MTRPCSIDEIEWARNFTLGAHYSFVIGMAPALAAIPAEDRRKLLLELDNNRKRIELDFDARAAEIVSRKPTPPTLPPTRRGFIARARALIAKYL